MDGIERGPVGANFIVTSESLDGIEAVNVSGELDQATAPELREQLEGAIGNHDAAVLVDLGGCEFIDSTGLSLLVETQRRLAEGERGFGVCNARPEVTRMLELTGIDAAVGLFASREEATAALARSRAID